MRTRYKYDVMGHPRRNFPEDGDAGISMRADIRTYSKRQAREIFRRHFPNMVIACIGRREPKPLPTPVIEPLKA